jgi:hypothetical protein
VIHKNSHPHTHTHTQLNSLHASAAPAIKTSQRTNKSKEDDDHTFAKTRGQLVSAAVASETIFSVLTKSCLRVKMIENSAARPPGECCVFFFKHSLTINLLINCKDPVSAIKSHFNLYIVAVERDDISIIRVCKTTTYSLVI